MAQRSNVSEATVKARSNLRQFGSNRSTNFQNRREWFNSFVWARLCSRTKIGISRAPKKKREVRQIFSLLEKKPPRVFFILPLIRAHLGVVLFLSCFIQ